MDEPVEVIPLAGFDPDGDPEIRVMAGGSLYIVFNFMPPSWAEDDPDPFDDFDKQLAAAVGVPVMWEDRETFRIERPAKDTVERIRRFLGACKRRIEP
jgi:hypothetical protein